MYIHVVLWLETSCNLIDTWLDKKQTENKNPNWKSDKTVMILRKFRVIIRREKKSIKYLFWIWKVTRQRVFRNLNMSFLITFVRVPQQSYISDIFLRLWLVTEIKIWLLAWLSKYPWYLSKKMVFYFFLLKLVTYIL